MPLNVAPLYTLLDEAVGETPRSHLHELPRQDADLCGDRRASSTRPPPACSGLASRRAPRSGCCCPTRPTFIVYFFAVLKAGGTVVNYNPLYTRQRARRPGQGQRHRAHGDARPQGAVRQGRGAAAVAACCRAPSCARSRRCCRRRRPCCSGCSSRRTWRGRWPRRRASTSCSTATCGSKDGRPSPVRIDPLTDIAVIQYTGGTTGTPKGAMLTHANVYVNVQQVSAWAPEHHRRRGARVRRPAVLPRVRADGRHELRHRQGRRDRHHAALLARRGAAPHRQDEADGDAGRADAVQRPHEPPQDQGLRSFIAEVLPVGRRAAARRGQGAVRGHHRLQGRRGLRPVGDLARRHLQSARGPGEGRLHRAAAAGHDHLAARSRRSDQGSAGRREGRDLHQGAAGHARLLQAPQGDGRADGRRVPAHRRRGAHGRGRLLLHRGPHQGPHHLARASTSIRAASRRRSTSTPASPR